jgi:hypothetical protein
MSARASQRPELVHLGGCEWIQKKDSCRREMYLREWVAADDVGVAGSLHSDPSRMSPHTHADSEKITAATRGDIYYGVTYLYTLFHPRSSVFWANTPQSALKVYNSARSLHLGVIGAVSDAVVCFLLEIGLELVKWTLLNVSQSARKQLNESTLGENNLRTLFWIKIIILKWSMEENGPLS